MRGLVQIYTGNGKGKTTAALGLALRASGHNRKTFMLQFMKGSEKYGEIKASRKFLPYFQIEQSGLDTFVNKVNPAKEDIRLALNGLNRVKEVIASREYDLIILDEINVALDYGLVQLIDVINLIKSKPLELDLVLTGRYCPQELYIYADLVSEIKEIKHHYQIGIDAREGIEF